MTNKRPITTSAWLWIAVALVLAAGVSLQQYYLGVKTFEGVEGQYTFYNNYLIFKHSYGHLVENQNLYTAYPSEHFDLYKYSPTFALFMGLWSWAPPMLGLILWNALNTVALLLGIRALNFLPWRARWLLLLFCLPEMVTSLQSSQSNVLISGLSLLALVALIRGRWSRSVLYIVCSAFVKIFGIVVALVYAASGQWRKAVLPFVLWTLAFFILPVFWIGWSALMDQYRNWGVMLQADESASYGISVAGLAKAWLGIDAKGALLVVGTLILLAPALYSLGKHVIHSRKVNGNTNPNYNPKMPSPSLAALLLASSMLWMVVFNHKAESPTFVIAMVGIGLALFSRPKDKAMLTLALIAFVFTGLASTDVFPFAFRKNYMVPYHVKAIPCVLAWLYMQVMIWQLLRSNSLYSRNITPEVQGSEAA